MSKFHLPPTKLPPQVPFFVIYKRCMLINCFKIFVGVLRTYYTYSPVSFRSSTSNSFRPKYSRIPKIRSRNSESLSELTPNFSTDTYLDSEFFELWKNMCFLPQRSFILFFILDKPSFSV